MFLQFLAPVWVALIAPRVFRARTEAIVYPALAIALAGLAVILAPSLLGEGIELSPWGVTAGLLAGLGYAAFQLVVKDLTKRVSAVTIVFTEAWLDALILLPLALWQTVGAGYQLTTRDLVAGLILGVVCTALAYLMWTYGMGMIKVQHSSILGYLEPVSAPIYALLLLGQGISVWTVIGGALIVVAGLLVVLLGEHEEEGADVPGAGAVSGGSHRLRGYAMVGGSAVMFGATGVWVGMTDLPASTVLCMRMALAAVLVALLGGAGAVAAAVAPAGRVAAPARARPPRRRCSSTRSCSRCATSTWRWPCSSRTCRPSTSRWSRRACSGSAPSRSSSWPWRSPCPASSSCWLRASWTPRCACRPSAWRWAWPPGCCSRSSSWSPRRSAPTSTAAPCSSRTA